MVPMYIVSSCWVFAFRILQPRWNLRNRQFGSRLHDPKCSLVSPRTLRPSEKPSQTSLGLMFRGACNIVHQISRFGVLLQYQWSIPNLLILMTVYLGPHGVTETPTPFHQLLYKFICYQQQFTIFCSSFLRSCSGILIFMLLTDYEIDTFVNS